MTAEANPGLSCAPRRWLDNRQAETYRDPKDRKHIIHPGRKFIMAAVADANGTHWAHARPTSLPNPNAGLDATKVRSLLPAIHSRLDLRSLRTIPIVLK